MSIWLLEQSEYDSYLHAIENSPQPSAEELVRFEASHDTVDGMPKILSTTGDTATIRIAGTLTDSPNFMAAYFGAGNTTYPDIIASAALAKGRADIKNVDVYISSGGGQATNMWITAMEAIKNIGKPTRTIIGNMAASAAYGLAVQTDEILAENVLSKAGSLGVLAIIAKNPDVHKITSKNAPNKAPDVETAEGKAVVQETLNAIEKVFIDTVAQGRDTTSEKVIADFGKGGIVLANDAVSRNMIDGIVGTASESKSTETTAQAGNNNTEEIVMDLKELKLNHGEIYAEAVADGVASERTRVNAHLKMGATSGAMNIAVKACQDGVECTAETMADHNEIAMKAMELRLKGGIENPKAEETGDISAADNAANGDTQIKLKAPTDKQAQDDKEDEILALVTADLGDEDDEDAY